MGLSVNQQALGLSGTAFLLGSLTLGPCFKLKRGRILHMYSQDAEEIFRRYFATCSNQGDDYDDDDDDYDDTDETDVVMMFSFPLPYFVFLLLLFILCLGI